jgi:7-cyano-7-deazaguanine synthase
MNVADQFFSYATANKVKVLGLNMDKEQIVRTALKLKAPLPFVWSCYFGHWRMCGECESCQRLKRALAKNKLEAIVHFRK